MDKLHIVKIGGKVIENKDSLISFLEDFASLEESKILIHGGGNEANNISKKILFGSVITTKMLLIFIYYAILFYFFVKI